MSYHYSSLNSIKEQQWISTAIGCKCGRSGIICTSIPLLSMQEVPCIMGLGQMKFRAICIYCRRQRLIPISIKEMPKADPDDIQTLFARVADYMLVEKGCEHRDHWCLSRSVQTDTGTWGHHHINSSEQHVHLVICAKCRKVGALPLPKGLSDYIDNRNQGVDHD